MANEPPVTYKVGPGLLTIGPVGVGQLDMTFQITGARVRPSVQADDDVPVLSGGKLTGDRNYSWTLAATAFQDLAVGKIVDYSWANKGTTQPFSYTPSVAGARKITGVVKIDPIEAGGDAKTRPTSEFEWELVGDPVLAAAP